jgi:hypothetical protein
MIPESEHENYAAVFNVKTGFWKAGEGCQIKNRYDRSYVCLGYSCHPKQHFKDSMFVFEQLLRKREHALIDLQLKEIRHLKKKT